MVENLIVSPESLQAAEKNVEDLERRVSEASTAEKPALQGQLDQAIRQLELLRRGTPGFVLRRT